uniref:Adenylate cyclase (Adenylyl cyclase)) n=1 Tax=Ganoderma boninense TaxID=34458 RepID=A0A5K1K6N2_9APHY|nr:Adenylate cyclase (EC (ATP pyrophosphate-lyase) (Adenylyl cyclase) [Ganoderma boninense]
MSLAPKSFAGQCAVDIKAEPHDEYPDALKVISVKAIHPSHGGVGSLTALKINRRLLRGDFLMVMDDESQELSDFATTLFDEMGHLKPEFIEHEHQKGSGVWGHELDSGVLLYVLSVNVPQDCRRKGVGSFLLQELAHSEHATPGSFLIAWPTPEPDDFAVRPSEEEWEHQRAVVVDLFHKNQFRRIGRTSFLAYATDPNHPSRSLPAMDDAKQNRASRGQPASGLSVAVGMLSSGKGGYTILRPGHSPLELDPSVALNTAAMDDLFRQIPLSILIAAGITGFKVPDIEGRIRNAYNQDPSSLYVKDNQGRSALRAAIYARNLTAIQALLALPIESGIQEELRSRDETGWTPVEACEREIRSDSALDLLLRRVPEAPASLRILYVLKKASGEDIQATQEEFINSRQWGCSCGQCTDGWLSPRMRYRLKWTAEVTGDTMMLDSEAILTRRQRLFDGLGIEFLPETYQDGGVSKSFYRGYTDAVRAVGRVLQKPGRDGLPLVPNLVAEFGYQTAHFLSGGADAAHQALSYTLFTAMEESPLGDKTWDDMQEELAEEGDAMSAQYTSLPKCANDLDFTRVAERTGLPDLERFQGYSSQRGYRMDVDDMGFRDEDDEEEDDGW